MKKIYFLLCLSGIVLISACYTTVGTAGKSGKIPPGQAKKMTGSKSARPYAPGQNKN